jgi:hypothetical protein
MTRERSGTAILAIGVACFLVGGLTVVLRALGGDVPGQEQTTSLAVAGLMSIAVGAALRRPS